MVWCYQIRNYISHNPSYKFFDVPALNDIYLKSLFLIYFFCDINHKKNLPAEEKKSCMITATYNSGCNKWQKNCTSGNCTKEKGNEKNIFFTFPSLRFIIKSFLLFFFEVSNIQTHCALFEKHFLFNITKYLLKFECKIRMSTQIENIFNFPNYSSYYHASIFQQ